MGGFTLAGNRYVFTYDSLNLCMCNGLYGFIDDADEKILFENNPP